jgi:hypothetical protein
LGVGPNRGPGGGEAVAPSRRQVTGEIERVEWLDIAGRDLKGRFSAEEIAEQREEPAHDGRIGVAPKGAAPIALRCGKRRVFSRPINHGRESLMRVFNERQSANELLEFASEWHCRKMFRE